MNYEDSHLSDQQLLSDVDGELSAKDEKLVRSHLNACWKCRVRRQEFEDAIAGFVRVHQQESGANLPSAEGPRALLKAQLSRISEAEPGRRLDWFSFGYRFASAVAVGGLLVLVLLLARSLIQDREASLRQAAVFSLPDASLTPGATVRADEQMICAQANANNKTVPVALQRRVFAEYRIGGADPRAYEVDYLVTPALGGADDIRNLWPHSYSATVWNARTKDALENRLRDLVCSGNLELGEAQREIATNWIAAYKKYFHTDEPLPEHRKERE